MAAPAELMSVAAAEALLRSPATKEPFLLHITCVLSVLKISLKTSTSVCAKKNNFCLSPRWFERSVYCVFSSVCVWDIRASKVLKATEEKNLSGIPTTFKHLDLTWKPHLKVSFKRSLQKSTLCCVHFFFSCWRSHGSRVFIHYVRVCVCMYVSTLKQKPLDVSPNLAGG